RAAEGIPTGAQFISQLVPANPFKAAADGNLLPIIVFVTIFGIAAASLPPEKRAPLTTIADAVTDALVRIVHWVLLVAPVGIFAPLYGMPFGVEQVFAAGIAVFLASLTVAAVPSGGVISLLPAFQATGLPVAGLTILIGLDRISDMFRTMANATGHLVTAVVVSAIENRK